MLACSNTTRSQHHARPFQPFCQYLKISQPSAGMRILWTSEWRNNQKEVNLREQMIQQSLQKFMTGPLCFRLDKAIKLTAHEASSPLADLAEIAEPARFALLLRFQEFGPRITCLPSPVLWIGDTHLAMRVQLLDLQTQTELYSGRIEQITGGPFHLRHTGNLREDLQEALEFLFNSSGVQTNQN